MVEKDTDKVTAFDTLFTTNRIQMYKILLSYLPASFQKTMAVYIKFSELIYTISFFRDHPKAMLAGPCTGAPDDTGDFSRLCEELVPYLTPREQEHMRQMKATLQNFKNMQDMMEMMHIIKEMFPEGEGIGGTPADILSAMGSIPGMDMDPSCLSQIMEMMQAMQ
ncbi:MAG: hypothetical protein J6C84_04660 [Lachnospiraceae bacterium]|nr:hypothetical protein [Lachnospiraceae bacterium]